MAEALAILGGVAASIQLIDTTVKVADELYTKFRSLETAEKDSQREIALLDGVKATLAQVSSYILYIHGTHGLGATQDLSLLSQHVEILCTQLKEVKDLVPTDMRTNYRARVKWASRGKIFDERIRNIEGQKLLLVLSLQTLSSRYQGLILLNTANLGRSAATIRTHVEETSFNVMTIKDTLSASMDDLNLRQSQQQQSLAALNATIPIQTQEIRDHLAAQDSILQQVGETLGVTLGGSMSRGNLARRTEHVIARIAREEIRRALQPVVEDLSQAQLRNEAVAEGFQRVADDLAARLCENEVNNSEDTTTPLQPYPDVPKQASTSGSQLDEWDHDRVKISKDCQIDDEIAPSTMRGQSWSHTYEMWLGLLRVTCRSTLHWNMLHRKWDEHKKLMIDFWPKASLLPKRCVSLLYNTEPVQKVYVQMLPAITTFPIVPKDSPVFESIRQHDIQGLRNLLSNGLASANDQDEYGMTLLHYAAAMWNLDAYKLLIDAGALPNRGDRYGLSPLDRFLSYILERPRPEAPIKERKCLSATASCFFETLLDTGHDPEESTSTIIVNPIRTRAAEEYVDTVSHWVLRLERHGFSTRNYLGLVLGDENTAGYPDYVHWNISIIMACCEGVDGGSYSYGLPPLVFCALRALHWTLERDTSTEQVDSAFNSLIKVIRAGADTHIICRRNERYDWKRFWKTMNGQFITPTIQAWEWGISKWWYQALEVCGYDVVEFYAEEIRRWKEFMRTEKEGATSTAVMVEDNRPDILPSTIRLRNKRTANDNGED